MMPAATHFDPVVGVDIHMVQPPGPVPPVPVPHPYVGIHFDPFDYAPVIGSTIRVNGLHRAIAGTAGKAIPPHIPIGGAFVPVLPANEHEAFMGALTVEFDGDAANFMALPCLSCQSIGVPPPPRLNPKKGTKITVPVLPLSVVLPVPKGPPVLIGGPPTISVMGLAANLIGPVAQVFGMTRAGQRATAAARRAADRAKDVAQRAWRRAFSWMPPGFLKCDVLRAEPVDVRTGEVVLEQRDFELPGRIPLRWSRHYRSSRPRVGVCGRGWDTPADARLEPQADGDVLFLDGEGTGALFDAPPAGGPVREPVDGWVLDRAGDHWTVRKKGGLTWYFPEPGTGQGEVLVEALVDACGNSVHYLRGPQGLERVVESAGRGFEVVSRGGLAERVVLRHPDFAEQRVMARFEYDGARRLVAVHDASDHPHRFGWDADGRMARHTNRVGLSFQYEYDAAGRCVRSRGDGGLYDYRFEYDPEGRWTNFTDSLGHRWGVELDERGNPVAETDPLGRVTSYAYDEAGRTVGVADPGGRTTRYRYDDRGNLVLLTMPDGAQETATYDASGGLLSHTDPLGNLWRQSFDRRGLVSERVGPVGDVWGYQHDARGDLVAVLNPLGATKRFESDRYGILSSITNEMGEETSLSAGLLGRFVRLRRPDGVAFDYSYDPCGRLRASRCSSGAAHGLTHDAEGRLTALRQPDGTILRYAYTGMGELACRTDADGGTVAYAYDTEERLVSVTNERGQVYRYERGPTGLVVRTIDYFGRATSYQHSAALDELVRQAPDGRKTRLRFDHAQRLVSTTDTDGSMTAFTYSAAGDLLAVQTGDGLVTRSFDAAGRLLEEKQGEFTVSHEYDPYGNRTRRRTSFGNDVAYAYDPANRLSAITINGARALSVRRDVSSRRVEEGLGPHLRRVLVEDEEGRLASEEISAGGRPAVRRRYAYEPSGRLAERWDEALGRDRLSYDSQGRLTRIDRAGRGAAAFEYDPAGDLAGFEGCLGAQGSLPDPVRPHGSCAFDGAGNLTDRSGDGASIRLRWSGTGRLESAERDGHPPTEFRYDGLARRIQKESGEECTGFLWDRDKLLGEQRGGAVREFVFYPDSFVPFAVIEPGGDVRYFACDNVGLPHRLLSSDGHVLWSGVYGPFGELEAEAGPAGLNPLRFLGQYADGETGLHYSLYRYYDPAIRSFISPDPLGLLPSENLYAYAPNPWNWVDPYGLACRARGDAEAYAARLRRSEEFRRTGFPTMASAVVDTSTGKVYLGRSGALPSNVHPTLGQRMPPSSLEEWPVNNCAEFDALNRALHGGASLDNLEMATVRVATGRAEPRCRNCRITSAGIWTATD
jgi:RHS repeat-associated protein